jgi:homoserine O-acetyltransferase
MTEAALGDLVLESGERILDFRQSYVTHGVLDRDGSNAVLVCSSLTGNHRRLDFLIGPGKALDPARYFIVATDAIGNGLSTSPSNSVKQPRMAFPRFTVRDMVAAQHRLLVEHLGIAHLHAIAGASMGGMQALQWAASHPRFMNAIVAMTPMAKTAPWAAFVVQTARACLMADPAWNGREFERVPERGWRAYAGLMAALLMRTPAAVEGLDYETLVAQHVALGFDAHDYLYQSHAYEAHDTGALDGVEARTLILAPPLDLFNPAAAAREAARRIPGARFVEIPSLQGHLAASATRAEDAAFLDRVVGDFLRE